MKGYIQIYTGNGKGKTTATIGLSVRAVGTGKKVFFAQFVKGRIYSEVKAIQSLLPSTTIKQYGLEYYIYKNPTQADIDKAREGFAEVSEVIASGQYDVVVLDEANIAIYYHLLRLKNLSVCLERNRMKSKSSLLGDMPLWN